MSPLSAQTTWPQFSLLLAYVFLKQLNLYSCKRKVQNILTLDTLWASSIMWFPGWVLIIRGKLRVEWAIRGGIILVQRQMTNRQTANLSYIWEQRPLQMSVTEGCLRKHCTCMQSSPSVTLGRAVTVILENGNQCGTGHRRLWIPFLRIQISFLETLLLSRLDTSRWGSPGHPT